MLRGVLWGAMIPLLRKSIELLSENPVLWLPYLIADLLAVFLWRIWGVVRTSIFHWFTTRQSVLGGDVSVPSTDYSALARASQVAIPIGFVTVFVIVCVFVIAFMATAEMLHAINREEKIDAWGFLARLAQRWGKLLVFSLKCLAVFGAFLVGVGALLSFILFRFHVTNLRTSNIFEFGLSAVCAGCGTWVLTPIAIRLLRGDGKALIPFQVRNYGAITAILSVEAGALLGVLLSKAEARVQLDSQFEWSLLAAFNSVVANAPVALLFVAIALLAANVLDELESGGRSMVHSLLQTVMPMHFQETSDPEE